MSKHRPFLLSVFSLYSNFTSASGEVSHVLGGVKRMKMGMSFRCSSWSLENDRLTQPPLLGQMTCATERYNLFESLIVLIICKEFHHSLSSKCLFSPFSQRHQSWFLPSLWRFSPGCPTVLCSSILIYRSNAEFSTVKHKLLTTSLLDFSFFVC